MPEENPSTNLVIDDEHSDDEAPLTEPQTAPAASAGQSTQAPSADAAAEPAVAPGNPVAAAPSADASKAASAPPSSARRNYPQGMAAEGVAYQMFVGDMPFQSTDNDLRAAFEEFGEVEHAYTVLNKANGKSKGFGFVSMKDESLVKSILDGRIVKVTGHWCKIAPADNRKVIQVSGFPPSCQESELTEFFRSRMTASLEPDRLEWNRSSRTALLYFRAQAQCERAYEELTSSRMAYGDTMLHVTYEDQVPKKKVVATVYVTHIPSDADEYDLLQLVKEFPTMRTIHVPRDRSTNLAKGIAFVDFVDRDGAMQCIEKLNGLEVKGNFIGAQMGVSREDRRGGGTRGGHRGHMNGHGHGHGDRYGHSNRYGHGDHSSDSRYSRRSPPRSSFDSHPRSSYDSRSRQYSPPSSRGRRYSRSPPSYRQRSPPPPPSYDRDRRSDYGSYGDSRDHHDRREDAGRYHPYGSSSRSRQYEDRGRRSPSYDRDPRSSGYRDRDGEYDSRRQQYSPPRSSSYGQSAPAAPVVGNNPYYGNAGSSGGSMEWNPQTGYVQPQQQQQQLPAASSGSADDPRVSAMLNVMPSLTLEQARRLVAPDVSGMVETVLRNGGLQQLQQVVNTMFGTGGSAQSQPQSQPQQQQQQQQQQYQQQPQGSYSSQPSQSQHSMPSSSYQSPPRQQSPPRSNYQSYQPSSSGNHNTSNSSGGQYSPTSAKPQSAPSASSASQSSTSASGSSANVSLLVQQLRQYQQSLQQSRSR